MQPDDIQVGHWYQRINDPDRIVKVTRADTLIAFDIPQRHRGHPVVSHSALRPSLFADLYQPYTD